MKRIFGFLFAVAIAICFASTASAQYGSCGIGVATFNYTPIVQSFAYVQAVPVVQVAPVVQVQAVAPPVVAVPAPVVAVPTAAVAVVQPFTFASAYGVGGYNYGNAFTFNRGINHNFNSVVRVRSHGISGGVGVSNAVVVAANRRNNVVVAAGGGGGNRVNVNVRSGGILGTRTNIRVR